MKQEQALCDYCGKPALKSGSNGYECRKRAESGSCEGLKPVHVPKAPPRNGPCTCGSGLKFKNCCLRVTIEINQEPSGKPKLYKK